MELAIDRLSAATGRLTAAVDRLEALAEALSQDSQRPDAAESQDAAEAEARAELVRSKAAYTDLRAVVRGAAVRLEDAAERIAAIVDEPRARPASDGDGAAADARPSADQ